MTGRGAHNLRMKSGSCNRRTFISPPRSTKSRSQSTHRTILGTLVTGAAGGDDMDVCQVGVLLLVLLDEVRERRDRVLLAHV